MIDNFMKSMRAVGIETKDDILADGLLHRFHVDGDGAGTKNGWYVLHGDNLPAGQFGSYKLGISEKWSSRETKTFSPEEKALYSAKMEASRQQRDEDRAKVHEACREWCKAHFEPALEASHEHPYLKRKTVKSYGLKIMGDSLMVPIRDSAGTLHGVQLIQPEGSKKFKTGTAKKGNFFAIGRPKDNTLLLAEGYATSASLYHATGHAVAVCFDAGNLKEVAQVLRGKYPNYQLILCADNDASGIGQLKAVEAAEAVGGVVVMPPDVGDDFNDFHQKNGAQEVKARIEEALGRTTDQGPEAISLLKGKKKWFSAALALGSVARFIDHPVPPLDFVFKDSLMAGTTGLMVGPGAAGKSTLAIMMLIAVATGRDILPGIFTPTRAGKVLGIFAEDDEKVLHHRVRGIVDKLFYLDHEARELLKENMLLITTVGHDVRFLDTSARSVEASLFFDEVLETIKLMKDLRFFVVDPTARFHGAEENDNGAGTFYVSLLEQLAQETGAAVVGLHHVSKRAGFSTTGVFDLEVAMHQDAARGASGLTNGVRWQCNLFGLPESYAKKEMGIKQARPGQYLAIKVSKKNYGKPEEVHFLERGQGGMLTVLVQDARVNDPDLDFVVKWLLLNAVFKAEGKQLTKRTVIDGNQQAWKKEHPNITRAAVEQTIAACIVNGELFERQGKNASGRSIAYLSCYPEPAADLEPENPFELEMEPEAFQPEEPEGTVKNELPVHNLLNLNDIVNPEKMNRKKDPLRFVSARNCGTVEPEIFTPYGGDISPSGLNRVDIPLLPMEAEDAEFF